MPDKFLDKDGLQQVAAYVKSRLYTTDTIPEDVSDGAVILYTGETTQDYVKGHIYQYNLMDSEWIDITPAGSDINVQSDWNQNDDSADDYIKNKPLNIVTDANYVHTDYNYGSADQDVVKYTDYRRGMTISSNNVYYLDLSNYASYVLNIGGAYGRCIQIIITNTSSVQYLGLIELSPFGLVTGMVTLYEADEYSFYWNSSDKKFYTCKSDVSSMDMYTVNWYFISGKGNPNNLDTVTFTNGAIPSLPVSGLTEITPVKLSSNVKTSEITNDSNFVSDANYVHTDNNYSDTDKNVVDGISQALEGKVDKVNGKALSTNDYTDADKNKIDTLGTAAFKNSTSYITPDSHDLAEAGSVYSAITSAVSSVYEPHGDITCEELLPALLIQDNVGNIYNITNSGTSTEYFIGGAGQTINVGDNVGIVYSGNDFLFNIMPGITDLREYQKKELETPVTIGGQSRTTVEDAIGALNTVKVNLSNTQGLLKNDGTVDTNQYLTQHQDISGKANKPSTVTTGAIASYDDNGNLVNSTKLLANFMNYKTLNVGADANNGWLKISGAYTGSANRVFLLTSRVDTAIISLSSYNNASITDGYYMNVMLMSKNPRSTKIPNTAGVVDTTNKIAYVPIGKDSVMYLEQIAGPQCDFTIEKVTELPEMETSRDGNIGCFYTMQPQTLTAPVTVNGVEQTTVQNALTALATGTTFEKHLTVLSTDTTSSYKNYYIKIGDIPTNNTSATKSITLLIGTRSSRYLLFINPWYNSSTQYIIKVLDLSNNDTSIGNSASISEVKYQLSSTEAEGTMDVYLKLFLNTSASPVSIVDISNTGVSFNVTKIGNDGATYEGTTIMNFFNELPSTGIISENIARMSDIPDFSDKADTVTGAVSGNFAGLDANGNLTDSGSKASDFYTKTEADLTFQTPETTLSGYGITNAYTKTEVDNKVSTINTTISNEATARADADTLLSGRIDALATLEEGSTTGDAELIDARTNYKGEVGTNLGESLRSTEQSLDDLARWASGCYKDDRVIMASIMTHNILPSAVNVAGSQYSSTGLLDGFEINATGQDAVHEGYTVTGYIPCTTGVRLCFYDFKATLDEIDAAVTEDNFIRVSIFDAEYNQLATSSLSYALTTNSRMGTTKGFNVGTGYLAYAVATFSSYSTMAYIRFSGPSDYISTVKIAKTFEESVVPSTATYDHYTRQAWIDRYNNYDVTDTPEVECISGWRLDTSKHWVSGGVTFLYPINVGDVVTIRSYLETSANSRNAIVSVKPTLENIVADQTPEGLVQYFGFTKSVSEAMNHISGGTYTSAATGWLVLTLNASSKIFSRHKLLCMINGVFKLNKFTYMPNGLRHTAEGIVYSNVGFRFSSSNTWTAVSPAKHAIQIPVTVGDIVVLKCVSTSVGTPYVIQLSDLMTEAEIGQNDPNTNKPYHLISRLGSVSSTTGTTFTITNAATKYLYISPNGNYDIVDGTNNVTGTKNGYDIFTNQMTVPAEKYQLEALERKVDAGGGTDIVSLNGGDLVLKNKLWNIQMGDTGIHDSGSGAKDILTILHFSDIHGNSNNLARIAGFAEQYSDFIDVVVSSGDQVSGSYGDDFSFWDNNEYAKNNFLFCMGNHDEGCSESVPAEDREPCTGWSWNTWVSTSDATFARYYANKINTVGTVWEDVQFHYHESNPYCYFYKDMISMKDESTAYYKIRLVFIDIGHQTTEQHDWFVDTLDNARTNGLSVIVISHFEGGKHDSVPTPFCSREWGTQSSNYPFAEYKNSVSDFITAGGEFICWLTGHTHDDDFGRLHDDTRQVDSNISTASDFNRSGDHIAKTGLRSQDCFNIMGIDPVDKIIKIMRVGRNYDRYMQNKDTMCYDYINGKLLYPNHE